VLEAAPHLGGRLGAWPERLPDGTEQNVEHATVLFTRDRLECTAPAFPPGSAGTRPTVRTDGRGLRVAGDFVELPYLAGLMERSSMSGVLAANDVLAEVGASAEPIMGIPQRGLLAGLPRIPRRGGKAAVRQ
jgi:isorenieratene synthase